MAATTRTSTLIGLLLPSFVNCASCSTCSSLAWSAAFISPISSRKIVPVWACSNLPMRVVAAPVKAPFSWPKSSLSRSSAGSAAQLTFTNGRLLARRALVDGARHQLLADAALAADEHGDVAVGDLLDDRRDRLHLGVVAPEEERPVLVVGQLPPELA